MNQPAAPAALGANWSPPPVGAAHSCSACGAPTRKRGGAIACLPTPARPSDIPPAWAALWKRPADGQALRATNVLVGIVAEVSRDGGKANMLPGVQREAPVHKRHGGARRVSRASTCWGFTFLLGLRLPANLVSPGEPRAHRWCGPSDLPASGTLPHTHRGKCGSSRGYSACARRWRAFTQEPDATEDGGLTMPASPDWLHLVLAALGAFVIGFLLAVIWTWRH